MGHRKTLLRVTMKSLREMQRKITMHPLHDTSLVPDMGTEALSKRMTDEMNYVVYARDVKPPLLDLEEGSIVVFTYDGKPAKWLNGVVYIRRDHLEMGR